MPSNATKNYSLSQWERSDKVLMEDFNADNAKLDAALKAEADARTAGLAALSGQLGGKGNCQIWTATYTGNGLQNQTNSLRISFPGKPTFAMIVGENGHIMTIPNSSQSSAFHCGADGHGSAIFNWTGATVSWYSSYPDSHMNLSGVRYTVIAFYAKG